MSDARLKRRRGTTKAAVTRLINPIGQAMDQNKAEEVRTKQETLSDAVTKFREAHEQYHATLDDDDDKDASTGNLTSVIRDVQDQRDTAVGWFDEEEQEESIPEVKTEDTQAVDDHEHMAPEQSGEVSTFAVQERLTNELKELRKLRELDKQEINRLVAHQERQQPLIDESSVCQILELTRHQYQSHVEPMRLPPTDFIKFDGKPYSAGSS